MISVKTFLVTTLLGALVLPSVARAQTLTPSKTTAVTSSGALLQPLSGSLAATISKGKAKNVLIIATSLQYIGSNPVSICLSNFAANGKQVVFPGANVGSVTCTNCTAGGCTITSNQWVDIDAAESSFAGQFKNQPIAVTVDYSVTGGTGATANMMVVTMQKK
jgi:hypothetical protein